MEINNINKCAQCRHYSICKYVIERAIILNELLKDENVKKLWASHPALFSLDFICLKYERDYSKRDVDPEPSDIRPISPYEDEYECVYNVKTGCLTYERKKKKNDEEIPF